MAAASEFYDAERGIYRLALEQREMDRRAFSGYLTELARNYPVISIEDGMAEDDWEGSALPSEVKSVVTRIWFRPNGFK